jgi:hypothetical protein
MSTKKEQMTVLLESLYNFEGACRHAGRCLSICAQAHRLPIVRFLPKAMATLSKGTRPIDFSLTENFTAES